MTLNVSRQVLAATVTYEDTAPEDVDSSDKKQYWVRTYQYHLPNIIADDWYWSKDEYIKDKEILNFYKIKLYR